MKMGNKDGFLEIYKRETGQSRSRHFTRQFSANEGIVKKVDLYRELKDHNDIVHSVDFNSSGDLVVASSRDRQVIFWNWEANATKLSYDSGHIGYVYHAKIMPFSDDKRVVTASTDGQVRLGEVLEGGQVYTIGLGKHESCAYRLATEPGNPHIIYSCGDDAYVQRFDLRSGSAVNLFCCSTLSKRDPQKTSLPLYDIVINPGNPNYFCTGGGDEYARLYDLRKLQQDASSKCDEPINTFCPDHLIEKEIYLPLSITGLAYSNSSELLVTYSEEHIYLFQKNMGLGASPSSVLPEDLLKLDKPQVFVGNKNATRLSGVNFLGPDDDYVLSGSICGCIYIWKKNGAKLVRVMKGDPLGVLQLGCHPHIPVIASCGLESGVKLWAPMANDATSLPHGIEKTVEWNAHYVAGVRNFRRSLLHSERRVRVRLG